MPHENQDSITRKASGFQFAIIYDNEEPVAAIATQTFDVVGSQLIGTNSAKTQGLPEQWKRKSLSLLKRRIMICGNVHTWGPHGVAIAAGQEPRHRPTH